MNVKNIAMLIVLIAVLAGGWIVLSRNHNMPVEQAEQHDVYTCPMHPKIRQDHPGQCPICGMTLVKVVNTKPLASDPDVSEGYAPVHVTANQEQLMGVRTATVDKRMLTKTIRAAGHISTNRDLFAFQDEYVKAYIDLVTTYRDYRRFKKLRRNWGTHRELQLKLYEVQDKLLSLGLSPAQIEQLQKYSWTTPWDQPDMLFLKNTDHYWVVAQVFEGDLEYVKPGQVVDVDIDAYAKKVKGTIRSVGGNIDPQSRTAAVLVELKDSNNQLKGNMFVDVSIPVSMGKALLIPKDAVMDTGLRKLVFVKKSDGDFEPREVQTGLETDEGTAIESGLKQGETIAISGNFLLDSESRLQAALVSQGGGQGR